LRRVQEPDVARSKPRVERERRRKGTAARPAPARKRGRKPDVWAAQRSMGNRGVEALIEAGQHKLTNPPAIVDAALSRSDGHPLERPVRQAMEAAFGEDLQNVRVHTDPLATDSAKAAEARAYSAGEDIVFGAGQYAPETSQGQALLAHELTHVVQQRQTGPVANTIFRAPLAGSSSPRLFPGIPPPVVTRTDQAIAMTVYFGRNLFLLDADNLMAVEKLADELRFMLDAPIAVDGYASEEGTEAGNRRLSASRRDHVIRLLKAKAIGRPVFGGTAHGEADQVAAETGAGADVERGRALNRRVTIVVLLPAPAKPSAKPEKKIDLNVPFKVRPETDEERSDRQIREALRTKIPDKPKTSFSKEFWNAVDEAVDSASRKVGIPEKYRGYIKKGARAAIEKGAEAVLDEALDKAGANETQKKAIKAAIEQAADTEL
jgi:outer membrane protein OmpA-like peptidoglycan-associated protein